MTLCKSRNNRGLGVWVSGRGHCVDLGLTECQTFISISLVPFMVARKGAGVVWGRDRGRYK